MLAMPMVYLDLLVLHQFVYSVVGQILSNNKGNPNAFPYLLQEICSALQLGFRYECHHLGHCVEVYQLNFQRPIVHQIYQNRDLPKINETEKLLELL